MTIELGEPGKARWLDGVEDVGKRSVRALSWWLLLLAGIRFLADPASLPSDLGIGAIAASVVGYYVKQRGDRSEAGP